MVVKISCPAAPVYVAHLRVMKLVARWHCNRVEDEETLFDLSIGKVRLGGWLRCHVTFAEHDIDIEVAVVAGFVVSAGFSK